jgi:hypothetical protein
MSFGEVKNLRKSGNLKDAFAMAHVDLIADPGNIWNKRSMGWVYFDQLKAACQVEQFEAFEQILCAIAELGLPAEEEMFWEQICWQVGKMAYAVQKIEPADFSKLDHLFQRIFALSFHKPSESYSYLLKAFQKSSKVWWQYAAFVEWWGLEHLRPEDYIPEEMPDGKRSMALAEQVAIGYARKLVEPPVDREKVEAFLPFLDQLIHDHPEYQYPPYFKGKLLLAIDDNENVFSAFLPFARKKQTEFWIWEQLAETFPTTDIRYAACLCRALLCRSEPQFLGKVRTKLAEWLIANQQLPEAKTEIEAIAAVYEAEGWRLNPALQIRMMDDWYQNTTALPDNRALYTKFQDLAEEILFGDVPEELVVVDFVNRDKDVLYFVGDDGKHGGLKYGKRLRNVRIGDLILVRFSGESRDGMYRVFTLKTAPKEIASDLRRTFEGVISIRNGQPFGFVDKVFVEPEMVKKFKLSDGKTVKGDCILSWNKKQERLTWKAISINL